jgi:hypothetical protein
MTDAAGTSSASTLLLPRTPRLPAASQRTPGAMNNGVQDTLAPLPHALALRVFSLLPVDARMRAREVSPGWRTTLNEVSLWMSLDVSATAGLARPATNILLRAAAARAGGHLDTLDVSDCCCLTNETVLAVVGANSGTLRQLRMCGPVYDTLTVSHLESAAALLRAAPQLRIFDADMHCTTFAEAHQMLSNEGLFVPMRVRKLSLLMTHDETLDAVLALVARLTGHTSLTGLSLSNHELHISNAALDAVLDAALVMRITQLSYCRCSSSSASALALARLLGGGTLTELWLYDSDGVFLDAPTAAVLGDALRANSSLTLLSLRCGLLRDPAVLPTLLGALTGHRSLRWLTANDNVFHAVSKEQEAAVGVALGALIAANAPALEVLDIKCCHVGNLGLVMDALAHNTRLRVLDCRGTWYRESYIHYDNPEGWDPMVDEVVELRQQLSAARASGTRRVLLDDHYRPARFMPTAAA